jgi:hypothetical protein
MGKNKKNSFLKVYFIIVFLSILGCGKLAKGGFCDKFRVLNPSKLCAPAYAGDSSPPAGGSE